MLWLILFLPFGLLLLYATWHDFRQKKYSEQRTDTTNEDYSYSQSMSHSEHNRHGGGGFGSGGES
ncbi:hypothetical protein [Bacillus sp. 2205SS5-2]|uniref:hypothetical protein n=1 Tax=Bacillus sp. 2205SS5-2 TaxID=3109031 RepID=UPI003005B0E9